MRSIFILALSIALPGMLPAQSDQFDPRRAQLTRPDLEALLVRLDQTASSQAYSERLRGRARFEAAMIRRRLVEGDFQIGDRILLTVQGEPQLTDTFTVEVGKVLNLPQIGAVSLGGVLRSEVQTHLQTSIGRFLRDPQITARSLMRVSVLGDVGQPGFYVVPTNLVLTDVLMQAGGPGRTAILTKIYIERGNEKIWEGEPLQQAITEGRTLDQLSLLAGDRIVVPTKGTGSTATTLRTVTLLLSIPLTIYGITRLF
jgi:hypothetical protein